MNLLFAYTIILNVVSVGYMGFCVIRYFRYIKHYSLQETRHTMAFGFLKLEHFVFGHLIFSLALAIFSVVFVLSS